MKANPRLRPGPRSILALPTMASAMLLAACVPQVAAPPSRTPPRPAPAPAPAPMPSPAATHWRDAPVTPGDWQWGTTGLGSTATFAGGLFVMRCDLPQRTVTLVRAGNASAPATMTITTESGVRTLTATPVAGGIAVSLPAGDRVLDAMAFSRGRFAIEVPGMASLHIPSWTEVSRVVEDCR